MAQVITLAGMISCGLFVSYDLDGPAVLIFVILGCVFLTVFIIASMGSPRSYLNSRWKNKLRTAELHTKDQTDRLVDTYREWNKSLGSSKARYKTLAHLWPLWLSWILINGVGESQFPLFLRLIYPGLYFIFAKTYNVLFPSTQFVQFISSREFWVNVNRIEESFAGVENSGHQVHFVQPQKAEFQVVGMKIMATCPSCSKKMDVSSPIGESRSDMDPSASGIQISCKHCNTFFTLPELSELIG